MQYTEKSGLLPFFFGLHECSLIDQQYEVGVLLFRRFLFIVHIDIDNYSVPTTDNSHSFYTD